MSDIAGSEVKKCVGTFCGVDDVVMTSLVLRARVWLVSVIVVCLQVGKLWR